MREFDEVFAVCFAFACQPCGEFLHVFPADFACAGIVVQSCQIGFKLDFCQQVLDNAACVFVFGTAAVILHKHDKLLHGFAAFVAKFPQRAHALGSLKQAARILFGIGVELSQRGVADAAFGGGGGTQEGGVVVGIGEKAHVAQHVFDFRLVNKTLPA